MKEVIIWGAGVFGKRMQAKLNIGGYNVAFFVDNSVEGEIEGIEVVKPCKLREVANDYEICICVRSYYGIGDVIAQLYDLGIYKAWIVSPEVYELDDTIDNLISRKLIYELEYGKKAVISKLEFHVVDNCNLNCVGCSHFAPIFEGGKVGLEYFEEQIRLVKEKFANILRFRLMGGEPFLHEDIGEFAMIARKYLPLARLEIVTNGLLYRKVSEQNWEKIKESKAILNISLYPPTFKVKDKIEGFLDKRGVKFSFGSGLEQYNDTGVIEEFHKCFTENKTHDGNIAIKHCVGNYCHYLRDGKISKCALPQLIEVVNKHYGKNFEVEASDIWDLREMAEPWEKVKMLRGATPFCSYCSEDRLERFSWRNIGIYKFEDYIVEE